VKRKATTKTAREISPSPGTPGEGRGEGSLRDSKPRPRPSQGVPLDLQITGGATHATYLRSHLLTAHQILRPLLQTLSIAIVNDAQMSRLHKSYLGIAGPTDVLTFELDYDSKGRVLAGEVIVCLPEAKRQARRRDSTTEKELLLYALHGMLHLSGFDDRTAAGYQAMHRKEDQILTRLGVGPVFAGKTRDRGAKSKDR
jgi:probable rRNA maturation factor